MYILKNAIKNLFRNKGRNLIVALIILTMLTFTAISMIINTTTDRVIDNYKQQFGSEIYLQYDEEKIREDQQNGGVGEIPELSDELKLKLADSEYLKETQIKVQYQACGVSLKGIGETNGSADPNAPISMGDMPNLTVYGYNTPELMTDFKSGKRKITSGKMFTDKNECVVSEDFAKLNNLQVGDTIKIRNVMPDADFEPLTLIISGIYFDSTENHEEYSPAFQPRNDVLTTYDTMKDYQENVAKTRLYELQTTYYLKSPDFLDAFNQEAHEKGLHKNWKMATDEMSYNKIVKPAENLANVSNVFLIGVLIVGSAILVLLSVLSIRERKYEIGVLRAMGMKKGKVVRGILYESLITIAICLVIGLSIGVFSAQPVADTIADSQQQTQSGFGPAQVEAEEIQVSLSADAALKVSGIAVLLAVISSSAGVLYILRYEPMKILSERN